ncbi:Phosphatidylinositol (PI) 3-kinase, partial [Coemansia spiralis]
MSADQSVDFSFCESQDINEYVSIRVDELWGRLGPPDERPGLRVLKEHLHRDGLGHVAPDEDSDSGGEQARLVFVTVQLFSSEIPLSLPLQTKYCQMDAQKREWREWIRFPAKYAELARGAYVEIALWDMRGLWDVTQLGACQVELFEGGSELVQGRRRRRLMQKAAAVHEQQSEATRPKYDALYETLRRYDDGDVPHVDWLDALAMGRIGEIEAREQEQAAGLYIHVEFPRFDFAVAFGEAPLDDPLTVQPQEARYCMVFDPEMYRDNPAEGKHRRLLRGYRTGQLDRELKPNASIRDQLNTILRYPPGQMLTDNEKNLVWKFRFYLSSNKRALTKFVKCVDWSDAIEAEQAAALLAEWSEVSIDDALELLGAESTNRAVRSHAVAQLRKATDDEL